MSAAAIRLSKLQPGGTVEYQTGLRAGHGNHGSTAGRSDDRDVVPSAPPQCAQRVGTDGRGHPQDSSRAQGPRRRTPMHDRALDHGRGDIGSLSSDPQHVHATETGAPQADPGGVDVWMCA
ncbi:hypothetical protein [Mycolicibacterium fortuitum]